MKIDISTSGPRDPHYVLEVAEAFAQCARVLNHLTRGYEALEFPGEAHDLLGYLAAAVSCLPQLVDQIGDWYAAELAAERIRTDDGSNPYARFAELVGALDGPRITAAKLQADLDAVTAITGHLGAPETGEDGNG